MDDLKESLKKYFEDRLSGPLFGYLFFSWVGFNWRALAVLGFDKRPVVEKIKFIDESPDLSWHFWLPLMLGVALASVSPYLHLGLQWVHNRALRAKDKNATNTAQRRIQSERQLVKDRVVLRNEDNLEDLRQKTRQAIQDARRKRIEANTQMIVTEALEIQKESARIAEENKEILSLRTQLEKDLGQIINGLKPLEKAETAEELRLVRGVALSALQSMRDMPWPQQPLFTGATTEEFIKKVKADSKKAYLENK
ncbi:hypothetical protein [Candidatus Pantoea floridensis]|uniref:Uncharacterized protein n=1 Tax=Candidatus Pantoea floridensis TaxID=1938870 RepID=A0A286BTX2_9GAMM|nr:hypothetical protein [Pantoea floridensis]PIF24137.1 hypothetical protein BX596_3628 [Enterobacteriaceae bacterium JKS000233]SOD37590.1 hypothetical protein SAMN06273570_1950 [Pantoea floridensis]